MHVIRPKSAKGRTRPKITEAHAADDELLCDRPQFLPHPFSHPPPMPRHNSSPPPRTFFRHTAPSSELENVLDISVLSLNKYKVLPSIEKRSEEHSADREEKSSTSRLHDGHFYQKMDRPSGGTVRTSVLCQEGEFLLALRTPCGQRLTCQFQPTDTLRDLVAAAEDKSGKRYGHVLIETMEVPRRSFTDLNTTLSQCGIVNKSVLCIRFKDGP